FYVSNFMGPELTDILSSLSCIAVMAVFLKLWKPKEIVRLEGEKSVTKTFGKFSGKQLFMAWLPYVLLVIAVMTLGEPKTLKPRINASTDTFLPDSLRAQPVVRPIAGGQLNRIMVPGLHNMITQVPPVVPKKTQYAALFEFNWLTASGSACFLATIAAALCL